MEQLSNHEPVAIVGMGCRWPGGAHSPSQFWKLLCNRTNAWQEFETPRFSSKAFHHPERDRPGSVSMKGAFLASEDARLFDHAFFGITSLEVETMDPSQRKLLEVAYEAIESAGETWESISGSRTGVFVGNFCLDHWMIQSRDWDNPRPYAFTGAGTSILANRISYIFNLQGPSLTVDTACSSSMYALHLAVNAIRAGDCDSAIVASANWIADPGVQIALDKMGALSASSRCHTFDARADGYARGEGYGAIYLKRVPKAVEDESPIRAVVRGTAINSNGRTGGITRPSVKGQEMVIRDAYRNAGDLPFKDTAYFECHGTGTYVGDPIEVAAVGNVFSSSSSQAQPLLIGSVKSNIGHGEGASALASIMKVVLALEKGAIPPLYDLDVRNANIDFEGANVAPVINMTAWPPGKLLRASINSFGYGGANAHCIIDHIGTVMPGYVAPGIYASPSLVNGFSGHTATSSVKKSAVITTKTNCTPSERAETRRLVLLPLSAHSERSLAANIGEISKYISVSSISLADIAYTLSRHRSAFTNRTFCIVEKAEIITEDMNTSSAITPPDTSKQLQPEITKPIRAPLHSTNLGFIFTGQGAQWAGMGKELFLEYHVFRRSIAYLDQVLHEMLPNGQCPEWTLSSIITSASDFDIQKAGIAQPICTAVQIGLVDLLSAWGVRPAGVVGHSSGEIAAAYVAGRVSAAEAIVAAHLRGRAVEATDSTHSTKGAMLAVGLSLELTTSQYLQGEEKVQVAAINSPNSVTLSGDSHAITGIAQRMTADGVFNRLLRTGGNAYHSRHMLPVGEEYARELTRGLKSLHEKLQQGASQEKLTVRWVSSVTPHKHSILSQASPEVQVAYWRSNLESPVRFSEAVTQLLLPKSSETGADEKTRVNLLVEIGPHPALKGAVEQTIRATDATSILSSASSNNSLPYIATLRRNDDGLRSMLYCAGFLFAHNAGGINMAAVNAMDVSGVSDDNGEPILTHGCIDTSLPPYQYTYPDNAVYHESRMSREYRFRKKLRHDLLGSRVVGASKFHPQWRNILRVKDLAWLGEHRLVPDAVLPAAAYVVMAAEAALRCYEDSDHHAESDGVTGFSLRHVDIKKPLVIPQDGGGHAGAEVVTSMELTEQPEGWATFSIASVKFDGVADHWIQHGTGSIRVHLGHGTNKMTSSQPSTPASASQPVNIQAWYTKWTALGIDYGPTFQSLRNVAIKTRPGSESPLTTATLNVLHSEEAGSRCPVHPASLDGAIQLGLIAAHSGHEENASTAYVPVHIPRLYMSRSNKADSNESLGCKVTAEGSRRGARSAYINLVIRDAATNQLILEADEMRCVAYSAGNATTTAGDITEADELNKFSSPFTQLTWKPDIRRLDSEQARRLYPAPENNVKRAALWGMTNKLAHLVVMSIYQRYGSVLDIKPTGNVGHFFDWICRISQRLDDHSEMMNEARRLAQLGTLEAEIDRIVSAAGDAVVEVRIAKLIHDHAADILAERRTGMDIIMTENGDLLTPLYREGLLMTAIYPQLKLVIAGLAHANPNARIIEIGGGTGGATRVAMDVLCGGSDGGSDGGETTGDIESNGIKAYREYTFTDISAGFLSAARETFANRSDMVYGVLDIETDPEEHGYIPNTYDLIIACQVLHATSDMRRTLGNCHKLLRPGGKMVMVETNSNLVVPGVVVGTFTGYWAGIPDGRVDAPFLSLVGWERELKGAGFSGLDMVLDDFPEPWVTTSVIVSTALEATLDPASRGNETTNSISTLPKTMIPNSSLIHIVNGDVEPKDGLGWHLEEEFSRFHKQKPVQIRMGSVNDDESTHPPPGSRVVLILSPSGGDTTNTGDFLLPGTCNINFSTFQHLVRNAASLVIVMTFGPGSDNSPTCAFIAGLLRVLRNENPGCRYLSVEVHNIPDDAERLARQLVSLEHDLQHNEAKHEQQRQQDHEFVWKDGYLSISRYIPHRNANRRYRHSPSTPKDLVSPIPRLVPLASNLVEQGVCLAFQSPGLLNSIHFRQSCQHIDADYDTAVKLGYVDIIVDRISLSRSHFDFWTGRSDSSSRMWSGFTGVIANTPGIDNFDQATGERPNDDGFYAGDQVYGLYQAIDGHVGTRVRVKAAWVRKIKLSSSPEPKLASNGTATATAAQLRNNNKATQIASTVVPCTVAAYVLDHVLRVRKGMAIAVHVASLMNPLFWLAVVEFAEARSLHVRLVVETEQEYRFINEELSEMKPLTKDMILHLDIVAAAQRFDAVICSMGNQRSGRGFSGDSDDGDVQQLLCDILRPHGQVIDMISTDFRSSSNLGRNFTNFTYSPVDVTTVLECAEEDRSLVTDLICSAEKLEDFEHTLVDKFTMTVNPDQIAPALDGIMGASRPSGENQWTEKTSLVVSFDSSDNKNTCIKLLEAAPAPVIFDPDAWYIIIGGLGGLGRSITGWMASRGAKHFALVSRRPASEVPGAKEFLESLSTSVNGEHNVEARCFKCDISNEANVIHLIKEISTTTTTGRPNVIKGIVHAAVSYADQKTFDTLTPAQWNASLAAKVTGTRNLHVATTGNSGQPPLDFFVMLTSSMSLYAFPTQSAYAAANNFQDAFARYRRAQGLAATTVALGLVRDVTDVGSSQATINLFERNKADSISEEQFLRLLEPAFRHEDHHHQCDEGVCEDGTNFHAYLDPQSMAATTADDGSDGAEAISMAPTWYSDARTAVMMGAFRDAQRWRKLKDQASALNGGTSVATTTKTTAQLRAQFRSMLEQVKLDRDSSSSDTFGLETVVTFVKDAISRAVSEILFIDAESVDTARSVAELGVDSLMAAELRRWFLQVLGADISMLDLLDPAVGIVARARGIVEKAVAVKEQ